MHDMQLSCVIKLLKFYELGVIFMLYFYHDGMLLNMTISEISYGKKLFIQMMKCIEIKKKNVDGNSCSSL